MEKLDLDNKNDASIEHHLGNLPKKTYGPFAAEISGPFRLDVTFDGEVIVRSEVETGYFHRKLERLLEKRRWKSILPLLDHLDPEGAAFTELAACLAVEELKKIEVPPRAQMIRIVVTEMTRISQHLGYIGRVARSVGGETLFHYTARDREKLLDLFELLSGARFSLNFIRFGGVRGDVTDGFIERVLELCEMIQIRPKEYNDLFTFTRSFVQRSAGVGVIEAEHALRDGITGPALRASGEAKDLRKDKPYTGYGQIDFDVQVGRGDVGTVGDAHDRFLVRLREIGQSVEIIRQALDRLPAGSFCSDPGEDRPPPAGEATVAVETARGQLRCYVKSDGGEFPAQMKFDSPSVALVKHLPALLPGQRVEDISFLVTGMDICISEADR